MKAVDPVPSATATAMLRDPLPTSANDPRWVETWHDLGEGAPTLAGLARICSQSMATGGNPDLPLSGEAQALLFAARERAMIEIKGSHRAFDAPSRMLAVYVEVGRERTLIFRNKENPAIGIRFLAGFRELCQSGLVMHHIYHDFSLTREGLERAKTIAETDVQEYLLLATEFGMYE